RARARGCGPRPGRRRRCRTTRRRRGAGPRRRCPRGTGAPRPRPRERRSRRAARDRGQAAGGRVSSYRDSARRAGRASPRGPVRPSGKVRAGTEGRTGPRPPPGPPGARAGRARAREGGRGLYSRYARRYARLVTMPTTAPHALADGTASDPPLRRFLPGLPGVDAVGLEARAASLGTRSIKTTAKAYAIDLAISMVDLTTLEGADTPGKVRALGAKAVLPDPTDRSAPATAAVCVYPDM